MAQDRLTYSSTGVSIDAGNEAVKRLAPHAKRTYRPEVLSGVGGFGAAFAPNLSGMRAPVLVSGADGVGSKLKIAFMMGKHDTVGIDCVAMNSDDVVCHGAEPLFFLDYLAVGKARPEVIADVVKGIAEGCIQAGCSLIGGETAELPDFYQEDEYDLAGFCVGVVDRDAAIDGSEVAPGDAIIGFASSGLHSNGFSLARKAIFEAGGYKIDSYVAELGRRVGEEMLEPTRIYAKAAFGLTKQVKVKGLVHITGGGFYDNIPRSMAQGTRARVKRGSWTIQPVFNLIQKAGNIEEAEMFRVFNMGIGMVAFLAAHEARKAVDYLAAQGFPASIIGEVVAGEKGVDIV